MKRYLLFLWESYEEGGGWNDFQDSFGTIPSAKKAVAVLFRENPWKDSSEIVDLNRGEVVWDWYGSRRKWRKR